MFGGIKEELFMAREQYTDLIRKVMDETGWEYGNLYTDGNNDEIEVLIINNTNDEAKLNELFKLELQANKIDTYPDYDNGYFYIELITGDNYGYADEYIICEECLKAYRRDLNGMGYNEFWIADNTCLCAECVRKDPSEYIDYLINNPDSANIILSDSELSSLGFTKMNEEHYANGLYDSYDNPRKIYDKIRETNQEAQILFSIYKNHNPFEVEFDVWMR